MASSGNSQNAIDSNGNIDTSQPNAFSHSPIPMLVVKNREIDLNTKALEYFQRMWNLSDRTAILAVYGPVGKGKSTFLNTILKAWAVVKPSKGFEIGFHQDSVTQGVWVYDGLIRISDPSNPTNSLNLIVLDIQGYGMDSGEGVELETIRLFLPCFVVADIVIEFTKKSAGFSQNDITEMDNVLHHFADFKRKMEEKLQDTQTTSLAVSLSQICVAVRFPEDWIFEDSVALQHNKKSYGLHVTDYVRDVLFEVSTRRVNEKMNQQRMRVQQFIGNQENLCGMFYPISVNPYDIMQDMAVLTTCISNGNGGIKASSAPSDTVTASMIANAEPLLAKMNIMLSQLQSLLFTASDKKIVFGKHTKDCTSMEMTILLQQAVRVIQSEDFVDRNFQVEPLVSMIVSVYHSRQLSALTEFLQAYFQDLLAQGYRDQDTAGSTEQSHHEASPQLCVDKAAALKTSWLRQKELLVSQVSAVRHSVIDIRQTESVAPNARAALVVATQSPEEITRLQEILSSPYYSADKGVVAGLYNEFLSSANALLSQSEISIYEAINECLAEAERLWRAAEETSRLESETLHSAASALAAMREEIVAEQNRAIGEYSRQIQQYSEQQRARAKSFGGNPFKQIAAMVVGVALSVFMPAMLPTMSTLLTATTTGLVASTASAVVAGAKGDNIWKAGLKGTLTAGVTSGLGSVLPSAVGASGTVSVGTVALRSGVHGLSGGVINTAFGGKFGHGFAQGAVGEIAASAQVERGLQSATVSAAASAATAAIVGGNVLEAALQGAFIDQLNHAAHATVNAGTAPDINSSGTTGDSGAIADNSNINASEPATNTADGSNGDTRAADGNDNGVDAPRGSVEVYLDRFGEALATQPWRSE